MQRITTPSDLLILSLQSVLVYQGRSEIKGMHLIRKGDTGTLYEISDRIISMYGEQLIRGYGQ